MVRILPCAALLLAAPLAAGAAEAPHVPPAPSIGVGGLFQVGLALLLVLGAVYALAWLMKRLQPMQGTSGKVPRVVGATAVGPRERVVLVEVEETWLVLGVAPGSVTALHTLTRPRDAATPTPPRADSDNTFGQWLKQTLDRNRRG